LKKTSPIEEQIAPANEVVGISTGEENSVFASLSASLVEIRKLKGVIGYILRSSTSALIDIDEPEKIMQYAILTSEMHDSAQQIAPHFSLGVPESILVEGENVKVLCTSIGENRVSVLMEKSATHAWIMKRILL
jgi:predicted regulator of Ras-like GTPase activity (Roadblock/LC7/MglB family)